jgi:hypothetical protein
MVGALTGGLVAVMAMAACIITEIAAATAYGTAAVCAADGVCCSLPQVVWQYLAGRRQAGTQRVQRT